MLKLMQIAHWINFPETNSLKIIYPVNFRDKYFKKFLDNM